MNQIGKGLPRSVRQALCLWRDTNFARVLPILLRRRRGEGLVL